jgi:AmmeMemoRadiSam system protein B/AmmeMemoRadiSam system protein A
MVSLANVGCRETGSNAAPAQADAVERIREPAVAGLFYPRQPEDLGEKLDSLLAEAEKVPLGTLRGLVCPHAGYDYSGPTAACAYKQVVGQEFETVVVLAPSHYAHFEGASVPGVSAYATPLGAIPLSDKATQLARLPPFCSDPECEVNRPGWWRQAPKEVPPFGADTPHTWEHSLEVQLPFLQKALDRFHLVPAVIGQAGAEEAAEALETILDDRTLLVASSDLSHYYPYDVAHQLDASCVRAICDLDVKWMEGEEACGKLPVLTLMHLARRKGWKTKLLDYRNSGDTSGDRSGVVGYAAVAFFEGGQPGAVESTDSAELSKADKEFLLKLARKSLTQAVEEGSVSAPAVSDIPQPLRTRRACFVTLTKDGELRGCIGHIFACVPLYRSVIENAAKAALKDSRFPPVQPEELDQIDVEVSVLTTPRCLEFDSPDALLEKLSPGVDGLVFRLGDRQSTYLPQVWEQIPGKEEFLSRLAQKAQLDSTAWREPEAAFLTYRVEAFHEPSIEE